MENKLLNIKKVTHSVTISERNRMNDHFSGILHFIGEDKLQTSLLMSKLEKELFRSGLQVGLINDAKMREGLNNALNQSNDALESQRRANEMINLMLHAGWLVLTDFPLSTISEINRFSLEHKINLAKVRIKLDDSFNETKEIILRRENNSSEIIVPNKAAHKSHTLSTIVRIIYDFYDFKLS